MQVSGAHAGSHASPPENSMGWTDGILHGRRFGEAARRPSNIDTSSLPDASAPIGLHLTGRSPPTARVSRSSQRLGEGARTYSTLPYG